MLFITHDIAVARKVSDLIAVMSCGRIVESGSARYILMSPLDSSTKELIAAASDLDAEPGHIK